jgi:uncharacterized protein YdaU (DUF1376 family)
VNRPWMPLYIADYRADTAHLGAAEHGAYLLLIMHYWQTGALPHEDTQLARIACMTPSQWKKARPVIAALFGPGWTHKRIDAELAHAEDISSKRRAAAQQRYGKPSAPAEQMQAQPQSHSPEESRTRRVAGATPPDAPDRFDEFWAAYPKRDGDNPKAPAQKKFDALVRSGIDPAVIVAGAKRRAEEARRRGEFGTRFVPQAVTWLSQQRFADMAEAEPPASAPRLVAIRKGTPEWQAWWDYHDGRRNEVGASFGLTQMRRADDEGRAFLAPAQWPPGYSADAPHAAKGGAT